MQNVWLMGGLSVLTSVPTTPQPVCLLCASKGRHEVMADTIFFFFFAFFAIDFCVTELIPFSAPPLPDDFLSDLLRALPQLLPHSRGASHGGEQGELVLQALQILPRVWPSKQEHKGKGSILSLLLIIEIQV